MSKITDLEEGEIMDLDQSTDQIIDDLLKVSIISFFRRRLKLKFFWWATYTLLIFPQQICAFNPEDNLYANTAKVLRIAHFDCQLTTSNKMFSLNKVAPCKIQPETIETTTAEVTLYQRHYSTKINATMCRIKHQSIRWFCDSFDSSGIDARQNIITTDIHISPDTWKHAAERGYVNFGYSINIPFRSDKKIVTNTNRGKIDGKYHNECSDGSWIHLATFESYMQIISLTVNLNNGTVNNWQNIPLPCPVYENGCETTSLDPFSYTWNEPENCIFSFLKKFEAKIIQNKENYYIVKDSFTKISNNHTRGRDTQQLMLKTLNKPQLHVDTQK